MSFYYQSGEEIRVGDRVTYGDEPAEVECIADPITDPTNWYVTECGGGVMLSPVSICLHETDEEEDLILVARKPES